MYNFVKRYLCVLKRILLQLLQRPKRCARTFSKFSDQEYLFLLVSSCVSDSLLWSREFSPKWFHFPNYLGLMTNEITFRPIKVMLYEMVKST